MKRKNAVQKKTVFYDVEALVRDTFYIWVTDKDNAQVLAILANDLANQLRDERGERLENVKTVPYSAKFKGELEQSKSRRRAK